MVNNNNRKYFISLWNVLDKVQQTIKNFKMFEDKCCKIFIELSVFPVKDFFVFVF